MSDAVVGALTGLVVSVSMWAIYFAAAEYRHKKQQRR